MFLKSLQYSFKSVIGITRIITAETRFNVPSKHYTRMAPRAHVSIANEDELFDVKEYSANPTPKTIKEKKPKFSSKKGKPAKEKSSSVQWDENIPAGDASNGTNPNKLNVNSKIRETERLLSSVMMNIRSKKRRKKNDTVLIEGKCFIKDALAAGVRAETIIFSHWEDINSLNITDKKTQLYKVPYRSIQIWSSLSTSPGMIAIFKKPNPRPISKKHSFPVTIICDNIRDPGNMGSILRAAAGVGCEKVLLTKGCVDFWDSKVLRSAAGAHYRIPILGPKDWDEIKKLISSEADVYVADNKINRYEEEYVMQEHEENASEIENESETDLQLEEENTESTTNFENNKKEKKKLQKRYTFKKMEGLSVIPYYTTDYTKNEVVLIVGGETHGLSDDSFKLIEERNGTRVNIPLNNNVDSLNAGMALGIVAFEMKRQFLQVKKKLDDLD